MLDKLHSSRCLIRDLTCGRCHMFITRSQAHHTWFNTLKMNMLVHQFMFVGSVASQMASIRIIDIGYG